MHFFKQLRASLRSSSTCHHPEVVRFGLGLPRYPTWSCELSRGGCTAFSDPGSSRPFHQNDMGVSENRGTLFGGPYNKDPTIFENPHIGTSLPAVLRMYNSFRSSYALKLSTQSPSLQACRPVSFASAGCRTSEVPACATRPFPPGISGVCKIGEAI